MFRKTVSLTGFISFIVLLVTSVVLYFEPEGRVAYWGDWHFLWLTKTDWGNIHVVVGTQFLVAVLLHIWLNWKPIITYMKNRARALVVFTPAMVVSLAVTLYFTIGSVIGLPVAQQVVDFSDMLKEAQTERYGNPPYGHAELSSLSKFCTMLDFDETEALAALNGAGIVGASPEATLKDIARANSKSPQDIYQIIRAALASDPFAAMPPSPPEGTGKLSLAEMSRSFDLPEDQLLARLAAAGITATPEMTVKQVASAAGMAPADVYSFIRGGK